MHFLAQVEAQTISENAILAKVSSSDFASSLGSNLNAQLAAVGLKPIGLQVLSITVYNPTTATMPTTANTFVRTTTALQPNWLTIAMSAVGNSSRSLEIAMGPFQQAYISADQFNQLWTAALPLVTEAGEIPFLAVPGMILSTVPGFPYGPGFSMELHTRQALSAGVAFAAVVIDNVSASPPTVRLMQFPLPGMRRGWCPAAGTDWHITLANSTAQFACNCAAAAGCGGAGVSCDLMPAAGNEWLPAAVESSVCSPPAQLLHLGLGLGIGLALPTLVLAVAAVRHAVLYRRGPPRPGQRRRRKPEQDPMPAAAMQRPAGAEPEGVAEAGSPGSEVSADMDAAGALRGPEDVAEQAHDRQD